MIDKIEELEFELTQFEPNTKEFQDVNVELEKSKNKLSSLISQQKKLEQNTSKVDFSKWTKSLKRTALALFGVQSVMSVVSKASSTYLSHNQTAQEKINALWVALGNLIGPIIEKIADGILKLVGYLNVFVQTLSNGKIDLTKNMNANANATKKARKEQEKYNASFDEMNTLGSNNTSTESSTNGFVMPGLNTKIVETLKNMAHWLQENWNWLSKVGIALAAVFGVAKISKVIKNIGSLLGVAGKGTGLLGLGAILKTIGTIGVVAIGVDLVYKALTGRDLIQDLKEITTGFIDLREAQKQNKEMTEEVHKKTIDAIDSRNEEIKTLEKGSQEVANYAANLISLIESKSKDMTKSKEAREEVLKAIEAYKKLYDENKLTDRQIQIFNQDLANMGFNVEEIGIKTKNTFDPNNYSMSSWADKFNRTIDSLKTNVGINLSLNKENITSFLNTAKNLLPTALYNKLSTNLNNLLNSSNISFGNVKMPKLAVGGIINNPGRGVPYHGATIGERGAEAVVPLTQGQQMELLGETIGRYVTINLTNVTQLDGRQIARKVDKISQNNDFVFNR